MSINQALNKILKEMWRLDEKISHDQVLERGEKNFYNEHLRDIKKYYLNNNDYWRKKERIK